MPDDLEFMISYWIFALIWVNTVDRETNLCPIHVSNLMRKFLGILAYRKTEISILCFISQFYAYFLTSIFIISRFVSLDFLKLFFDDPNVVYILAIKAHILVLAPLELIVIGIEALIKKIQRGYW